MYHWILTLATLTQLYTALDSASVYSPVSVSSVTVPQYGVHGEHAVLYCIYSSIQPVYSVRWYKNGKEFFSYLPGKLSPISVHNLPGINVEVTKSSMNYVTLSPLTLASTGRYRCEVSEEGPMFATDSAYGDLLVVVVPQEGPRIEGANSRYFVGEKMKINCTSAATLPPANLTWYINQKLVPEHKTIPFPVSNTSLMGEQLQTNTLGLEHIITRHDMNQHHPNMKIKCVASIYTAYYKTVEILVGRKMRRRKSKRRREDSPVAAGNNKKGDSDLLVSLHPSQTSLHSGVQMYTELQAVLGMGLLLLLRGG